MKDGPTKKQLHARIAKLEAELARFRAGDTIRAEGEHWYELLEYFDADEIRRVPSPWKEPTYLMGMLKDTFIVEVPKDAAPHDVDKFLQLLKTNGMAPALAIRKGVRFVKLATVSPEMEKRLDEVKARVMAEEAKRGESEQVPALRSAEGRSEDPQVPAVPGADGGGPATGEADPQRDAPRE